MRILLTIPWIKRNLIFLTVLLSLSGSLTGGVLLGAERIPAHGEFVTDMNDQIPELMGRYAVPGLIIGLIHDGSLVWKEAFGYADALLGTPLTTETVCRMESLSKPVTALGVMKLADQGLIDLDSPVVNYLHSWEFPPSDYPVEEITWRMLLSHTSGLPLGTIGLRYAPAEERPSLRKALTKDAVLDNMPGNAFCYSNTGFNLLEMLTEEVTNRDFSMYMQDEILEPLGMYNSGYRCKPQYGRQVPTGYDIKGRPIPLYVYSEEGAGGLFSTLEDYSQFLLWGMQAYSDSINNFPGREEREEMYTSQIQIGGLYGLVFPEYGFGHFIEPLSNGLSAVSHGGQGTGWMTHFHIVPETGEGIIIFCNSQRSWPLFAHILQDWGEWSGFGDIGMSRILPATNALWIFTGIIAAIAFWLIGKVLHGLTLGNRLFSLYSERLNTRQIFLGIFALLLIGVWIWAVLQDYLFISAVFPVTACWLGYAVLLLSLAFLMQFLFPKSNIN